MYATQHTIKEHHGYVMANPTKKRLSPLQSPAISLGNYTERRHHRLLSGKEAQP